MLWKENNGGPDEYRTKGQKRVEQQLQLPRSDKQIQRIRSDRVPEDLWMEVHDLYRRW